MVLAIFFGVTISSIGVSLPAIAKQIFFIDVKDAGPLIIVPLGIGALSALTFVTKLSKKHRKKTLINHGLKIILLVFVFMGLFLPLLGKFIIPAGVLLSFVLGAGGLLVFIPNQTLLQENIDPKLRGRVFGTLGFATTVITLPVILFSATIIDTAGIRPFLIIAALLILLFLLFFGVAEKAILAETNGNN